MVDNTSTDSNSGPTIIFKKKLYFHLVLPCEDAFHEKFHQPWTYKPRYQLLENIGM